MKFRKLPIQERRQQLRETFGSLDSLSDEQATLKLADTMIENSVGVMAVPLGLATGFAINGQTYDYIPMATEEPSIIAAASFAATAVSRHGGFVTASTEPIMHFQIFWDDPHQQRHAILMQQKTTIESFVQEELTSLEKHGGGLHSVTITSLPDQPVCKLDVAVNVGDAQGANRLNTCAERLGEFLFPTMQVTPLMAILSNSAHDRRATATFSLPAPQVVQLCKGLYSPEECVRRVILANDIAQADPERAVTHNKGIMNGITALALATGNDTRAVEAAAHTWAARNGSYQGLTQYQNEAGNLTGRLELPLPLATVGGATQFHPTAQFSLKLLKNPNSPKLARIAAALGLAQNLAALCALVSTGIQAGHMPLHQKKQGNSQS